MDSSKALSGGVRAVPEVPGLVLHAVADRAVYGERFTAGIFCAAPHADRLAVDAWLVAKGHPLAYQPGTAQSRFLAIVREMGAV